MRQLTLSVFGGSCPYTENNVTYPGYWLGQPEATFISTTCNTIFDAANSVVVSWGSVGQPIGTYNVPPFAMTASLTSLTEGTPVRATWAQVSNYLDVSVRPVRLKALCLPC